MFNALVGCAVLGTNFLTSVSVIIINKRIVTIDNFPYVTILGALHFYCSFCVCCMAIMIGKLKFKGISTGYQAWLILRVALASLGTVTAMNMNLQTNTVEFYQISKLMIIPVCIITETVMGWRQQQLSVKMITSLVLILVGMGLFLIDDFAIHSTTTGLFWAGASVFLAAFGQVFYNPTLKALEVTPEQLLFLSSPVFTVLSALLSCLKEDMMVVAQTEVTGELVRDVILSCVAAAGLNFTTFRGLEMFTPLAWQIVGHAKTICIVMIGVIYFDSTLTNQMILGMSFAFAGMILFTEENRLQGEMKKAAEAAKAKELPGESALSSGLEEDNSNKSDAESRHHSRLKV